MTIESMGAENNTMHPGISKCVCKMNVPPLQIEWMGMICSTHHARYQRRSFSTRQIIQQNSSLLTEIARPSFLLRPYQKFTPCERSLLLITPQGRRIVARVPVLAISHLKSLFRPKSTKPQNLGAGWPHRLRNLNCSDSTLLPNFGDSHVQAITDNLCRSGP
jgi:hypothetical protein